MKRPNCLNRVHRLSGRCAATRAQSVDDGPVRGRILEIRLGPVPLVPRQPPSGLCRSPIRT